MQNSSPLVQLDPGRTLCWEGEDTLRVGFDRQGTRVDSSEPKVQRLIERLISGIPEHEVDEILRDRQNESPDTSAMRDALIALRPALVRRALSRASLVQGEPETLLGERAPSAVRATICDDGSEIPEIRSALETNWLCSFTRSSAPPELAVQVLRFLEPLERTSRWLSDGIPHLLIRYTDESIRVGPLISRDGSPCHSCEVLSLVERDAALPALAVQLYGRRPSSESHHTALAIGAAAAHYVQMWRSGARWVHNTQLCFPVVRGTFSGLPEKLTITTHPECGCALSNAPAVADPTT
ncbi:MAG: hypothetical protein ACTIJ6_05985 [Leucobacter sp.]